MFEYNCNPDIIIKIYFLLYSDFLFVLLVDQYYETADALYCKFVILAVIYF